jgi:PAS domain S-box-containing protein
MSSRHLLWIGSTGEETETVRSLLQSQLDDLIVRSADDAREALVELSRNPGLHLLAVVELGGVTMELGELIKRMKQINPAVEIIVIGQPGLSWNTLNLPRYYRPVLLMPPVNQDVLVSCVAKLKEMVEAKEDHADLMRSMKRQVALSRVNVEGLIEVLHQYGQMGMIVMRRDGFFLSYNAEASRLTGYTLEEMTHIQSWAQKLIMEPESLGPLLETVDKLWEEKSGTSHIRVRVCRKDGTPLILDLTLTVILNDNGQPRRMLVLLFDPFEKYGRREYQALIENGMLGLYTYAADDGFIRMSTAALNLINRAFSMDLGIEDILGRRVKDLPLPHEMAVMWQHSLEAAAKGEAFAREDLLPIGLPGQRIVDHAFMVPVAPGADDPRAVLAQVAPREDLRSVTFQDASIQVLAEKTFDAVPQPGLLLEAVRDEAGTIQDFLCLKRNAASERVLRFRHAMPFQPSLTEVLPNDRVRQVLMEHAVHVTDTGRAANFELWLDEPSQSAQPILLNFWIGKVGDGVSVFFQDVTEQRNEERQLKQYRHCFDHMQEAIIITDLEGNIVDWNPASERMFGYVKSLVAGQPSFILTRKGSKNGFGEQAKRILREHDVWKGEYEFIRTDGTRGVAFITVGLLKDDAGEPYGMVGLCHDLTDHKRLEERLTVKTSELQEKNRALNTLLRHAEEERLRACEQVVSDLTGRLTERVFQIMESKRKPDLVDAHARLLLKDLGIENESRKLAPSDPMLGLSEKELEVARLIRLGKTSEEIAFILEKSLDTVRLQRISIRKKLGLKRRTQSLAGVLKRISPM